MQVSWLASNITYVGFEFLVRISIFVHATGDQLFIAKGDYVPKL